MALNSGKIIATFYDEACEQLEKSMPVTELVEVDSVDINTQQNANDIYWRNVEQQRPLLVGRDQTGNETSGIEQAYPLQIDAPRGDFMEYNISELRDEGFMKRSVRASKTRIAGDMESRIVAEIADKGSLYYEESSADFDFVAQADTILTERQSYVGDGTTFLLDPRTSQLVAGNLASRTVYPNNRSEEAYATAMVGENVAGFDVYRNAYAGTVVARQNATTTTVASDVTEVPAGFQTVSGAPQNIDYRSGVVSLTSAANYQVGDVITFAGVNSVSQVDKTDTGQLMTFRIIAVDTNDITVYPKPIAADQAGITDEQAAYANISTAIVATMVVSKVNANGGRASQFMANDSICVVNGREPLELLSEFDGMKVERTTLSNGIDLYMAYDASISTLNARVRLFTRYGVVNKDPSRNGNAVKI